MPPPPAITQALTSLLPSFPASNKSFPPALITQCESLLALSRQRASNLKTDEEIARAHACSEIAAKRLRLQLRLPAIKNGAGAPCKPRTYTKLITFLEGVLTDAPTGSLTPKGRKRDANGSLKEAGSTQKSIASERELDKTPSKRRVLDKSLGSTFAGKIKNNTTQHAPGTDQVPPFVMPSIRKLCKKFSTPSIAPHVYTGTCIILPLAKLYPLPDSTDDLTPELINEITTLIIALYLMVLTRMRKGNMTDFLYTSILTQSLQTLDLPPTASEAIENWVAKSNSEGWCNNTDWFSSVPEDLLVVNPPGFTSSSANDDDDSMDINHNTSKTGLPTSSDRDIHIPRPNIKLEPEGEDPKGILLPGLGTMLHDGLDYTAADRKLDYREWKAKLLRRMAALEKNDPLENGHGNTRGRGRAKGKEKAAMAVN